MPRAWKTLCQELETYLTELEERNISPETIKDYRFIINKQLGALKEAGLNYNPRKVGKPELIFLRDEFFASCSPRTKKHYAAQLRIFLQWAGNPDIKKINLTYGDTQRKNVRWLNEMEAASLKEYADGIERFIVHCELDLGMRRIEVLRLNVSSFELGRVNRVRIHGKGRNGGKFRTISVHPHTARYYEEWMEIRQGIIEKAREENPNVKVPLELLIHPWNGGLEPYKKSAINSILDKLGRKAGIKFSNHDLRRTCGRMMFKAGIEIERIAKIFGHKDTKTTMEYLGLEFDDMSESMAIYASYQERGRSLKRDHS